VENTCFRFLPARVAEISADIISAASCDTCTKRDDDTPQMLPKGTCIHVLKTWRCCPAYTTSSRGHTALCITPYRREGEVTKWHAKTTALLDQCPGPGNSPTDLVFEPIPLRQGTRDTFVDMKQIADQEEGDLFVGWVVSGEWLRYTVNVLETGERLSPC